MAKSTQRKTIVGIVLILIASAMCWLFIGNYPVSSGVAYTCLHPKASGSVDAVNLLNLKSKPLYATYLAVAFPLATVAGTKLVWFGEQKETILGQKDDPTLLLIRYKSFNTLCRMLHRPYYQLFANPIRKQATAFLGLSILKVDEDSATLPYQNQVIAVFLEDDKNLSRAKQSLASLGATLIYSSHVVQNLDDKPIYPSDPHPIPYKILMLFDYHGDVNKLKNNTTLLALSAHDKKFAVRVYDRKEIPDLFKN